MIAAGEATESFADGSVALTRPDARSVAQAAGSTVCAVVAAVTATVVTVTKAAKAVSLFPTVRLARAEGEAHTALGRFAIENEVERVVGVDAAAVGRAVGRDLRDRVRAAVAALLFLAQDEDGRALEY